MNSKFLVLLPSTLLIYLTSIGISHAQVVEDNTLSTNVTTEDNLNFAIAGGEQRGSNLFHSFEQFSIPTNGSASFNNSATIQNIISRVTGLSPSRIDGLIKNNGGANLFLLNPQGVIFGKNAALDLGGSFITSTAESLIFVDGSEFGSKNLNSAPLLTVSTPLGLQFGKNPATIINRSQFEIANPDGATGTNTLKVGLSVLPSKTLALIGGDILIDGGSLTAPGGKIELGSVAADSLVTLESLSNITYESITQWQNITLDNLATVNVSGEGGGDINLQGKNIDILNGSVIASDTLGAIDGGKIEINATESLKIVGSDKTQQNVDQILVGIIGVILPSSSRITSNTFGQGKGSDIKIITNNLSILDGGEIELQTIANPNNPAQIGGGGGNLQIEAREAMIMQGSRPLLGVTPNAQELVSIVQLTLDQAIEFNQGSTISTSSISNGKGGNIDIVSKNLTIKEGNLISSSPFRSGAGGNINITLTDSLTVEGISTRTGSATSLITSNTFNKGNGGNIEINADKLTAKDGGGITATTFESGTAGNIDIKSSQIELNGVSAASQFGSFISSQTTSAGNAGDLTIDTRDLTILDGAAITVEGIASGSPGNLEINANSIALSDRATITAATTSGMGGNIQLQVQDNLTLRRNSTISAQAVGDANGGNIDIDANFILAVPGENSDILTKAVGGNGGNININTQGIFNLNEGSSEPANLTNDIDASSQFGLAGSVRINLPQISFTPELFDSSVGVVDVNYLLKNSFCRLSKDSSYVATGRSGIPVVPENDLSTEDIWEDWRILAEAEDRGAKGVETVEALEESEEIEPIQGWVRDGQGNVVLTAQALVVTPHTPATNALSCR